MLSTESKINYIRFTTWSGSYWLYPSVSMDIFKNIAIPNMESLQKLMHILTSIVWIIHISIPSQSNFGSIILYIQDGMTIRWNSYDVLMMKFNALLYVKLKTISNRRLINEIIVEIYRHTIYLGSWNKYKWEDKNHGLVQSGAIVTICIDIYVYTRGDNMFI